MQAEPHPAINQVQREVTLSHTKGLGCAKFCCTMWERLPKYHYQCCRLLAANTGRASILQFKIPCILLLIQRCEPGSLAMDGNGSCMWTSSGPKPGVEVATPFALAR